MEEMEERVVPIAAGRWVGGMHGAWLGGRTRLGLCLICHL